MYTMTNPCSASTIYFSQTPLTSLLQLSAHSQSLRPLPNTHLPAIRTLPLSLIKPPSQKETMSRSRSCLSFTPWQFSHPAPSLALLFPNLPTAGSKSRVETQIKVVIDLADNYSSTDPLHYDRVGSWKWLRLPDGTATKKRVRKQGRISQ